MKIKVDIDCTPQEARTFFGLPDLEPMQDALLGKIQERLSEHLEARDPETLLRLWFPGGFQHFGQMQEQLWKQFMSGMSASGDKGDDKTKGKR